MNAVAAGEARKSAGSFMSNPLVLLLVTGSFIGANFPLGKIAGEWGVTPMLWGLVISVGAASMMLPVLLIGGDLKRPSIAILRYSAVSAVISFITPNLLVLSVIPHVGAGYTGLMFALSPICTVVVSAACGIRLPGRIGMAGIVTGLAGAAVVSLSRGANPEGPTLEWLLIALLIPVVLALGNVYRTRAWPEHSQPNQLAFWGHLFAILFFVAMLWVMRGEIPVAQLAPAGAVVLAQVLISGMTFPFLFRLQRAGGPVLLSQIGYVAAAVGLLIATVVLGERYGIMTWFGAVVIIAGIGLTAIEQRARRRVTNG